MQLRARIEEVEEEPSFFRICGSMGKRETFEQEKIVPMGRVSNSLLGLLVVVAVGPPILEIAENARFRKFVSCDEMVGHGLRNFLSFQSDAIVVYEFAISIHKVHEDGVIDEVVSFNFFRSF